MQNINNNPLMINKDTGIIISVSFVNLYNYEGTVVNDTPFNKIGDFSNNWIKSKFVPYKK